MATRVAEVFDVSDAGGESDRPTLPTGQPPAARAADRPSTPPAGEPPAARAAERLSTPLPSERSLPAPPPLRRLPFRPSAQAPAMAPSKPPSGLRPSGPPRAPSFRPPTAPGSSAPPHRTELDQLRAELAAREARIQELELRLREHEGLTQELAACDARLDQLSRYCAAVERVRHQLNDAASLMDELGARTSCIPELEQRIARLETRTDAAAAPSPPVDDLRRISGIGPAFERTLHGLGVRTYAEIAAWTAPDTERIARLLRVSAARVNGWPEQARALALQTSPAEPGTRG
jgi:predicted flap endonuclease-1-like 5' DNA nuclease